MARCLISFGANIGDAWGTIQLAAARLQERLCKFEQQFRLSRCFRTPPIGGPVGQPPFINAVAALETTATPWDVWHCIRETEKEFGRERNQRWEARRIDLDIVLFDQQRIWTPHLKIPHPRMCMRRFILLPAVDVAHDWLDPVSGWTIGQLAENVRTGPSNFVLLADAESKPESLLAEVARRTGAAFHPTRHGTPDHKPEHELQRKFLVTPGRWVASCVAPIGRMNSPEIDLLCSGFEESKLYIAIAPRVTVTDAAWEDYHRSLASALGLQQAQEAASRVCTGPRYLLASDDRDWAIQELVAALEAMDCPIEVSV